MLRSGCRKRSALKRDLVLFKEKLRLTKKCINNVKGNFEPGCLRGQGWKKTKRAPAMRGGAVCRKSRFIYSDIVTNSGEDFILSLRLFILCWLCFFHWKTWKHLACVHQWTLRSIKDSNEGQRGKEKSIKEEFAYSWIYVVYTSYITSSERVKRCKVHSCLKTGMKIKWNQHSSRDEMLYVMFFTDRKSNLLQIEFYFGSAFITWIFTFSGDG